MNTESNALGPETRYAGPSSMYSVDAFSMRQDRADGVIVAPLRLAHRSDT